MEEEKKLQRISELSDEELETEKLQEAWKSVERNFLSRDMAAMVGYLATFWSALEMVLLTLLRELHLLPDGSFTILVVETSFLQRMDLITSSLSVSKNQDIFDEWADLETELNKLRNQRNHVVHGFWTREEAGHLLTRITTRRKPQIQHIKFTALDVQKLTVYIIRALKKLTAFRDKCEKANLSGAVNAAEGAPLDRTHSQKARALGHRLINRIQIRADASFTRAR